jgi:hypothetical protein
MTLAADNSRRIHHLLRALQGTQLDDPSAHELQRQALDLLQKRYPEAPCALLRKTRPSGLIVLSLLFVGDTRDTLSLSIPTVGVTRVVDPSSGLTHTCDLIQVVSPESFRLIRIIKDRLSLLKIGDPPWPDAETWREQLFPLPSHPIKTAWERLLEDD